MDIKQNCPFALLNILPAERPSAEPAGSRGAGLSFCRQSSDFLYSRIERKLQAPVPDVKSDRRRVKSLYPA